MQEEHRNEFPALNKPVDAAPFPPYPPSVPFSSSRKELLTALFSYVIGYLYIKGVFQTSPTLFLVFAAVFTATALVFYRSRLRQAEHWGLAPRDIQKQVERKHIFTHIRWEMRGIYLEVAEPAGDFVWLTG